MNKREFLKDICKLGMCSCTLGIVNPNQINAKEDEEDCEKIKEKNWRLEWRLNHSKKQFGMLLNKIEPEISPQVRNEILEDMGRNCAKSLNWAEKYKDNPEGFFEFMFNHSGENIKYDRANKKITIVTRERDCDCPIVNSSITPEYYCNCSLGWQKETYEVILGKQVEVELKESVLRGSNKCVFEVTVI